MLSRAMAGKCDHTSLEAAIAGVAEAGPHANLIRDHLREILASAPFRGSSRSRDFLSHVVECALARQWDRLKERSLGVDVFGREASYDTGGDSIVRVTASDVRRRLAQYYSECVSTVPLRVEIPAGSYIPKFGGFDKLADVIGPTEPALAKPKWGGLVESTGNRSPAWSRFRKAALALVVLGLGWVLGVSSVRLHSGRFAETDSHQEFYRELLGPVATDPNKETDIVLSNPRLLLYVGSHNAAAPPWPSTLDVRVPNELEKMLNPAANDVQAKYPFHFLALADQDYTGLGEAVAAFNMGRLLQRVDRAVRVTESRFLNWGAVRNVHLILLGAPQMSVWVQESLERSNFTMEHDAITNARPLSGEREVYNRSVHGNILDDYGLIWMARSPSGSRQLLMAGLTSAGTAGVSDFFCDPERMRPIYEKLLATSKNGSMVSEWQVLLHIHARENVPLQIDFVSLRAGGMNR